MPDLQEMLKPWTGVRISKRKAPLSREAQKWVPASLTLGDAALGVAMDNVMNVSRLEYCLDLIKVKRLISQYVYRIVAQRVSKTPMPHWRSKNSERT